MLSQALLDVKIGAGWQTGTANAPGDVGATKAIVKAIGRDGVVIEASAKTPFGTDVRVAIGAVTGIVRYKSRGAGRKKENIVGRTGKDVGKRGGICTLGFAL